MHFCTFLTCNCNHNAIEMMKEKSTSDRSDKKKAKVTPLPTLILVLRWFCICAPLKTTSVPTKIAYIFFTFIGFLMTMVLIGGSVTFFLKFMKIDLEEALYALCQISVHSGVLYVYIVAFFLRRKFEAIFENLSKIYRTSKSSLSIRK